MFKKLKNFEIEKKIGKILNLEIVLKSPKGDKS